VTTYIQQCPDCGIIHENLYYGMEQCDKCRKKCTVGTVLDEHEYRFGHDTNCLCGAPGIWTWHDYRSHLAQVIDDHLKKEHV